VRLESLGFPRVYRYEAGKTDWSARGLPVEGRSASVPSLFDAIERDVPTCWLNERANDVWQRLTALGEVEVIVTDDRRTVLGRVRMASPPDDPNAAVENLMHEGPATFRPDVTLHEIHERMVAKGVDSVLVTDPDGRLMGRVRRASAERLHPETPAPRR
jgi:CBS domain-containing protein